MSERVFDFYGETVSIVGDDSSALDNLEARFKYFSKDCISNCKVQIILKNETKDLSAYPPVKSIGVSPRNFYFKHRGLLLSDYFGKAFTIYNQQEMSLEVFSLSPDLMYEIVYLFILSQIGTLLEQKGIFRTHGVSFESGGKGFLLLLPSGGGKSSLALRLLEQKNISLISEDTPLVGPKNRLYPFPLGLGVDPKMLGVNVEDKDFFSYQRMEFAPKNVVLPNFYIDRIVAPGVPLRFILIGKRRLGAEAKIVKSSVFGTTFTLIKKMVIGLGLFQGIEYLLHRPRLLKISMFWLLLKRFFKLVKIQGRSRSYIFYMSYDYEENLKILTDFISQKS